MPKSRSSYAAHRPWLQTMTLLAVLCLLVPCLTGCGGSGDADSADTAQTETDTSDASQNGSAFSGETNTAGANNGTNPVAGNSNRPFPRRLNVEGIYIGTTYDRADPGKEIQYIFQVQTIYSRLEMARLFGIYNNLVLSSGLNEIHLEVFKEEYSKGFAYMGDQAQWRGVVLVARLEDNIVTLEQPYYWGITGGTNLMQQISPELVSELGDRQIRHILLGSCCDDILKPEVHWQEPRAGYPMEDSGEFLYWKFKDLKIVGTQFHATSFESLDDITQDSFNAELDRLDVQ